MLRNLAIAFLHFCAVSVGVAGLAMLLPPGPGGWFMNVVVWAVTLVLGFLFTEWAFHREMPTTGRLYGYLSAWLLFTVCGYLILGIFILGTLDNILLPEVGLQLALGILGILVAGYRIRRHRVQKMVIDVHTLQTGQTGE